MAGTTQDLHWTAEGQIKEIVGGADPSNYLYDAERQRPHPPRQYVNTTLIIAHVYWAEPWLDSEAQQQYRAEAG